MNNPMHVAAADCERCRDGVIAQPVNTVSSLAFSVAGALLIARSRKHQQVAGTSEAAVHVPEHAVELALGWSAVAAGLGSVAYHGPGTRAGQILHDASLITMLATLIAADVSKATGRPVPNQVLGVLPIAATGVAASRFSLVGQVVTGIGAAIGEVARVRRHRSGRVPGWRPKAEVAVAGVGAIGHVFGRTGGPLCRKDSPFQAHAAWHTAMAIVLVLRD